MRAAPKKVAKTGVIPASFSTVAVPWPSAPRAAQNLSARGGTLNSSAKPTAGMAAKNPSLRSSHTSAKASGGGADGAAAAFVHESMPSTASAMTMPSDEPSVSTVASAQRPMPMFMKPLSTSESELISGKPGTSINTAEAIAIWASLPIWTRKPSPATRLVTNAVAINTSIALKCSPPSHCRTRIPQTLAAKVSAHTAQLPPERRAKQAQETATSSNTSHG